MSSTGLMLVVALAAALLAVWVETRFDAGPRSMATCFAHLGGSLLVLTSMPALIQLVVDGADSPTRKLVAVLGVALPVLLYAWLATIWLLKLVQRTAHLR